MFLMKGLRGRRVIVNLATGEAFRGEVVGRCWFTVRLSGVTIATPQGSWVELDGHVRFPRSTVIWIQEL